ncbi:SDR family NAD(P)-dependent oxidoreductase [Marisediminicola antarctica]|uniref:Short-chain dehydrogenase n=1 Tax=Marisediminicola antarctica TaxID=674079 RepID=A0A7L5AMM5_9MICO|nr:SDR family oxidoreductase [Marisediminicola antarctica]QHO70381.1 short-chain dehydrogenase [Marisediminicola antarctica]
MTGFEGIVAIVTGGSSGIGAATAVMLHEAGARVAVLDRMVGADPRLSYKVCDLVDRDSVDRAVAEVAEELGGIDVLINNAGIGAVGDIAANSDDEWRNVFDVNVLGIARVTRAALPFLKRSSRAAIVNTSSVVAKIGVPQRALYSATKGAVLSLTLAMAADHLSDGIRVNAVLPGTADTPWVSRLLADSADAEGAAESLRRRQPMGRLVTAEEVATSIVFLANPQSMSTTGTLLLVDGGMAGVRVPVAG